MNTQPDNDSTKFYCGCLKCLKDGKLWRSRSTWYRHQNDREKQIKEGKIPPPDPAHVVPARAARRKRVRDDETEPEMRRNRPRQESMPRAEISFTCDAPSPHASHNVRVPAEDHMDFGDYSVANEEEPPASAHESSVLLSGQSSAEQHNLLPTELNISAAAASIVPGVGELNAPPPLLREAPTSRIPMIDTALKFIHELQLNPLIEDDKIDKATQWRLRHPLAEPATLSPDEQLSVALFLADTDGSEKIYNEVRKAILARHPEDTILTHYRVKKKVAELSGITPILEDMCPNTCLSYTGPFRDLESCPYCQELRYDPILFASCGVKKPHQQFNTFPVGPQIQARFRSPEGATDMLYRKNIMPNILAELQEFGKLDVIEDIPHGSDFWDAYQCGRIKPDDVCLIFSMDGAQLYEHKASNCWIYIWILVDVAPDKRYKKKYIMPGAIVPGPNKPKNPDSFLFPGLHHVAALQNEGLVIWDAARDVTFDSRPWIVLAEADAVGAPELTGYVGHHSRKGCRNGCGRKGRRKPGGSHYYAVCLKPDNYSERGCDDSDYEPSDLPVMPPEQYEQDLLYIQSSTSISNYEARRLETGLSKPSIFIGLAPSCRLSIPGLFPGDIMHLLGINLPDLLQKLLRGLVECDIKNGDSKDTWDWVCLVGDVWKQHGDQVAAVRQFLPSSFDRPPRNPAEKISSGYKCWEFLHWLYGLAPALLYGVLPDKYWQNFCKLVAAARIIFQRRSSAVQRKNAHRLFSDFVYEFEELYVQRKISRMHFLPQCVHASTHTATETCRIGSLICSSQFTMEHTIGDMGAEIRQPSKPFANLAQRALRRAQVNGLKAMFPNLDHGNKLSTPRNTPSHDLGDGYFLLHPREDRPRVVRTCEEIAIFEYLEKVGGAAVQSDWLLEESCIQRWARCCLPNGQICRSAWKEIPNKVSRVSRNVKFRVGSAANYAEVLFYFQLKIEDKLHTLALASQYGPPNQFLLKASSGTVWVSCMRHDEALVVIDVKDIIACVAMIPYSTPALPDSERLCMYFAMDKMGSDIGHMGGADEPLGDLDSNGDERNTE